MSQVTIQTDKKHRVNKSCIIAGKEVKFDEYGMAEVPSRYVESILLSDPSLILVDEEDVKEFAKLKEERKNKPKEVADIDIIDENKKLKAEVKKLEQEVEKLNKENSVLTEEIAKLQEVSEEKVDESEKEEVVEDNEEDEGLDLSKMKKAELQELCEKLEYPKEEWEEKTVKELVAYIESKLEENNE